MTDSRATPLVPVWLLAALLAVVTMVLYIPALSHGFVGYDDPIYVTSNHRVQAGLTWHNVAWAFTTGEAANWHPLTWLSLMLDVDVFGPRAAGFHLTNVVLHAADAVLLFWLLWRLTDACWRSFAVAILFAWHPLHVESVAWISERKDVLSAFFGFLALIFYGRYCRLQDHRGKVFYGLSLLTFALGLMSKPMLVTWPFVLLLLDYWPLERFKRMGVWPLVREKIPFFGVALAACVVTFLVQREGGAVASFAHVPVGARAGNALISYCRYLEKLLWPADLAVLYTHPGYWPGGKVLLAVLLLAGVSVLFWRGRARHPYALVGWLWFLGTLVPVIGLVQVGEQSMADRYSYLPSVGILIIAVWGVGELGQRPGAVAFFLVAVVACFAVTRHQLEYWRNGETLFQHALAVGGNSYTAHANLGAALLEQGNAGAAITELQAAIQLNPRAALAHADLGVALSRDARYSAAVDELQTALKIKPAYEEAHYNLGIVLLNTQQPAAAAAQFQAALRLDPEDAEAHNKLGLILATSGQNTEAVSQYQEALRLKPGYADAHYNLGTTLLVQNQLADAQGEFQTAIQLAPDYAPAHNNLGIILTRQRRLDEAIGEFEEAVRLDPNYAKAQTNLAMVLSLKNKALAKTASPSK